MNFEGGGKGLIDSGIKDKLEELYFAGEVIQRRDFSILIVDFEFYSNKHYLIILYANIKLLIITRV